MKHFRLGTDIKIKWTVTINEGAVHLRDADLTLQLVSSSRRSVALPIQIIGDHIEANFYGKDQKDLGIYYVTLWLNYGKVGQAVLDHMNAFNLVASSALINGQMDDYNHLNTEAAVEMTDVLELGIQGDSAYQVWLNQGYVGSEADFLQWLKGPKGDPGDTPDISGLVTKEELNGIIKDFDNVVYITDYPTAQSAGVVKIRGTQYGVSITSNGVLQIAKASDAEINTKDSDYKPIVPSNIDAAVKAGLISNHLLLTDEEKAKVQGWIGMDVFATKEYVDEHSGGSGVHVGEDEPEGNESIWIDPSDNVFYIAQTIGESKSNVMSQYAVTRELENKASAISRIQSEYGSGEVEMDTNLAITALSYTVINHYHDVEEALKGKVNNSRQVNGKSLDADISLNGKDIPYGSGSNSVYQELKNLNDSLIDSFKEIDERFNNLPTGTPEVHIGSDAPTGDEVLWVDPDEQVIVHTTGQATNKVMSQKAITDLIGDVESVLRTINGE